MTSAGKNYSFQRRSLFVGIGLLVAVVGCAPRRPYRAPVPPRSSTAPAPREPQISAPSPPSPPAESSRRPLPQDPRIREQDIGSKAPATAPATKEAREPRKQTGVSETGAPPVEPPLPQSTPPPPLPDDSSLLAKITPGVSPQRAASLRLTEEGRKLLDGGEPAKSLTPLERSIAIDSTNPYGHFYLAKAQQRLGRYQESLNFLDVAESRLGGEPFWLAEVHALRGENFRALGQLRRAEVSYDYALRLNSGNRTAVEALARMQSETQPASR